MATSGNILVTTTAKEIIQETLELLGAVGEGETANTAQEASLLRTLRSLCVTWQADGLNLFAVTPVYFFLSPKDPMYTMPGAAVGSRYESHSLASDAAASANSVTLNKAPDASYDTIGITLDTGEYHWGTISTINDTTVSFSPALPSEASENAYVVTATASPQHKFMKALSGTYRAPDNTTIPMTQMSREEYDSLSRKDSTGIPLQFYVDTQATFNDIYIWPTPIATGPVVRLDVQRQLDSPFSVNDDVAFPAEWFLPLATNLAWVSSAKYGVPVNDTRRLQQMAAQYYDMANDFDFEWGTSIFFQPNRR